MFRSGDHVECFEYSQRQAKESLAKTLILPKLQLGVYGWANLEGTVLTVYGFSPSNSTPQFHWRSDLFAHRVNR
jgi:hypothetical protein